MYCVVAVRPTLITLAHLPRVLEEYKNNNNNNNLAFYSWMDERRDKQERERERERDRSKKTFNSSPRRSLAFHTRVPHLVSQPASQPARSQIFIESGK